MIRYPFPKQEIILEMPDECHRACDQVAVVLHLDERINDVCYSFLIDLEFLIGIMQIIVERGELDLNLLLCGETDQIHDIFKIIGRERRRDEDLNITVFLTHFQGSLDACHRHLEIGTTLLFVGLLIQRIKGDDDVTQTGITKLLPLLREEERIRHQHRHDTAVRDTLHDLCDIRHQKRLAAVDGDGYASERPGILHSTLDHIERNDRLIFFMAIECMDTVHTVGVAIVRHLEGDKLQFRDIADTIDHVVDPAAHGGDCRISGLVNAVPDLIHMYGIIKHVSAVMVMFHYLTFLSQ